MNIQKIASIVLCIAVVSAFSGSYGRMQAADEPVDIIGTWEGSIDVYGSGLRIVFNIAESGAGVFNGTVDSPDQGAKGIPIREIKVRADSLFIDVTAVAGNFAGKYDPRREIFEGLWNQSSMNFPLSLHRSEASSAPVRPQMPQKPYPYRVEDVSYRNESAGITLAGTLTMPDEGTAFPAVVLITGSGQQDRDEEIFGHRPFLVLADHLTRMGIAVLRSDDRGIGGSGGDPALATTEDFAADVNAAIEYLKSRPEIDHDRTGLAGHSEGGLIAPMVAAQRGDVAFMALLAAPGFNGGEILIMQTELIFRETGLRDELMGKILEQKRLEQDIFREEKDVDKAVKTMIRESVAFWTEYKPEELQELERIGYTYGAIEQRARIYSTPWFRFFLAYEPVPALMKVKCPVLAVGGEKDLQVPAKENLAAIEKALTAGVCGNFKVVELPGLNHLFQTCERGSIDEYGKITETFAPEALDIVGAWILEVTGQRSRQDAPVERR